AIPQRILDGAGCYARGGVVEEEDSARTAVDEARRIADAIERGGDIAHIGAAVGDGIDRRTLQSIVSLRANAEDKRAAYGGHTTGRHGWQKHQHTVFVEREHRHRVRYLLGERNRGRIAAGRWTVVIHIVGRGAGNSAILLEESQAEDSVGA